MKNRILVVLILFLFVGVIISPSINADKNKVSIEITPKFFYEDYTQIQLVFLLINKLRYYECIESEEDVLEIIESDAELSGIVEELKCFDCGCEEETLEWPFPYFCRFILIFFIISILPVIQNRNPSLYLLIDDIGEIFNCYWADWID